MHLIIILQCVFQLNSYRSFLFSRCIYLPFAFHTNLSKPIYSYLFFLDFCMYFYIIVQTMGAVGGRLVLQPRLMVLAANNGLKAVSRSELFVQTLLKTTMNWSITDQENTSCHSLFDKQGICFVATRKTIKFLPLLGFSAILSKMDLCTLMINQ